MGPESTNSVSRPHSSDSHQDNQDVTPEFSGFWRYHRKLRWLWRHRDDNPYVKHGKVFPRRNFARFILLFGMTLVCCLYAGFLGYMIAQGDLNNVVGLIFLYVCFGWPLLAVVLLQFLGNNRRTLDQLEEMWLTQMQPAQIVFGSVYRPALFFISIIGVCYLLWIASFACSFEYYYIESMNSYERELFQLCLLISPIPFIMGSAFFMVALRGWLLLGRHWTAHLIYTYTVCLAITIIGAIVTLAGFLIVYQTTRSEKGFYPGMLVCSALLIIIGPYWTCRFAGELFFNPLQPASPWRRFSEEVLFWHGSDNSTFTRRRRRIVDGWIFGVGLPTLALILSAAGLSSFIFEANTYIGVMYLPKTYTLTFHPLVHWLFSPIIFWAMFSLICELHGEQESWKPSVHWGLIAGLLATFFASLQCLYVLPLALIGILFFGAGLLGFSPYFAFVVYLLAVIRYFRKRKMEFKGMFGLCDLAPLALLFLLISCCGYAVARALVALKTDAVWTLIPF